MHSMVLPRKRLSARAPTLDHELLGMLMALVTLWAAVSLAGRRAGRSTTGARARPTSAHAPSTPTVSKCRDAQRRRSDTADQAAARHAYPVATAPATGAKSPATGTIVPSLPATMGGA